MNKEEILVSIRKSFVRVLEHDNFELNETTTLPLPLLSCLTAVWSR